MRHVVHVLSVPASTTFLRGQLRFLSQRGYRFTVVSSPGDGLEAFAAEEGCDLFTVEITRAISPYRDAVAIERLARHLRRIRPDLVHAHTPKGGLVGMAAATAARVPARIYHLRGLPLETARGTMRMLLRIAERTTCALADRVLSVSPSLRAVALEEGLVAPPKISVLGSGSGNGVDVVRFDPSVVGEAVRAEFRRRAGVPSDAVVIGFVGRLVGDKGVRELAEAWRTVRARDPNVHLLVAGRHEARDGMPDEVRSALEGDPRVHLPGHVADMPAFYAAVDVLVLPTYREGLPNVLLEAGAMQLPVVATRATGCVDVVEEGKTGALVPIADASALADALLPYVSDARLRREHGVAARQRMLSAFSRERIWTELETVYASMLA